MAADAIAVPAAVTQGVVHLTDGRRYVVPVTLICPEFTPSQAKEWVEGSEVPDLAKASQLEYVDIDSGHWPMFTQPHELAQILADCADG